MLSSKKIRDADLLNDEYEKNYGSSNKVNVQDNMKKTFQILSDNKIRLSAVLGANFVVTLFFLYWLKPGFIQEKKEFPSDETKVNKSKWVMWGMLLSVIFFVIFSIVSYKVPFLKKYIFSETCNLCKA